MANIRVNDRVFDSVQYARISQQQCEKLHNASLEILERTGVCLYYQEAVDLLTQAGAFVADGNRVRMLTLVKAYLDKSHKMVPHVVRRAHVRR